MGQITKTPSFPNPKAKEQRRLPVLGSPGATLHERLTWRWRSCLRMSLRTAAGQRMRTAPRGLALLFPATVVAPGFPWFYPAVVCDLGGQNGASGRTGAANGEEFLAGGWAVSGAVSGAGGGPGSIAGDLKRKERKRLHPRLRGPGLRAVTKLTSRSSRRTSGAGVRFAASLWGQARARAWILFFLQRFILNLFPEFGESQPPYMSSGKEIATARSFSWSLGEESYPGRSLYSQVGLNDWGNLTRKHSVEFLSVVMIRSDQKLSRVRLFATPWIAACQASLSNTNSLSSLRLTSIVVMIMRLIIVDGSLRFGFWSAIPFGRSLKRPSWFWEIHGPWVRGVGEWSGYKIIVKLTFPLEIRNFWVILWRMVNVTGIKLAFSTKHELVDPQWNFIGFPALNSRLD